MISLRGRDGQPRIELERDLLFDSTLANIRSRDVSELEVYCRESAREESVSSNLKQINAMFRGNDDAPFLTFTLLSFFGSGNRHYTNECSIALPLPGSRSKSPHKSYVPVHIDKSSFLLSHAHRPCPARLLAPLNQGKSPELGQVRRHHLMFFSSL